jgi:hypothetical protein
MIATGTAKSADRLKLDFGGFFGRWRFAKSDGLPAFFAQSTTKYHFPG